MRKEELQRLLTLRTEPMKNRLIISVTLLSLLLTACETPYGENNFWRDGGYEEQRLSDDTYVIRTVANRFTDMFRAQQYNLRRAAELTVQNGYTYFEIIDENRDYVTKQHTTNGVYQSQTFGSAYLSGNTVYGATMTTGNFTPPKTTTSTAPQPSIRIKMLHDPVIPQPSIYVARDVLRYTENLK